MQSADDYHGAGVSTIEGGAMKVEKVQGDIDANIAGTVTNLDANERVIENMPLDAIGTDETNVIGVDAKTGNRMSIADEGSSVDVGIFHSGGDAVGTSVTVGVNGTGVTETHKRSPDVAMNNESICTTKAVGSIDGVTASVQKDSAGCDYVNGDALLVR